jgi:NitT/TauT family transport system permease protein
VSAPAGTIDMAAPPPRIAAAVLRWLPLLLLALLWEVAPSIGLVNPRALPSLHQVLEALWRLAVAGDLTHNGLQSLKRLAAGLGLGIVIGTSLGLAMAWWRPVHLLVNPLARCLYPMPKSALIPVMLLWLGLGDASKITLIFLGCLLPVLLSAYNGARGVDRVLVWSARSLGCSRARALVEIVLPAALPELLAGIRSALGFSFVLLVSSEFLMARDGLGYLIAFTGEGGAYDAMFAGVLVVSALGFLADRLYLAFMRRALAWQP